MAAAEFACLPRTDGRDELEAGRVVREPLPGHRHARIATRIAVLLARFVDERQAGVVFGDHAGYVVARDPDTVRGPDASFVTRERYAAHPASDPYLDGAADLTVEVLSPSDRPGRVAVRVAEYLAAGTRLLWLVDPERETVIVYRPGAIPVVRRRGDLVDGADVLPGFDVAVADLFEP